MVFDWNGTLCSTLFHEILENHISTTARSLRQVSPAYKKLLARLGSALVRGLDACYRRSDYARSSQRELSGSRLASRPD